MEMITKDLATTFYTDDLKYWIDALNWLYIDAPLWETATNRDNVPLSDMFGNEIPSKAIYFKRKFHPELEAVILSLDAMKALLFLLYHYNLGLERFTSEDLPRTDAKRTKKILEGSHSPINFNDPPVTTTEDRIMAYLRNADESFREKILTTIELWYEPKSEKRNEED